MGNLISVEGACPDFDPELNWAEQHVAAFRQESYRKFAVAITSLEVSMGVIDDESERYLDRTGSCESSAFHFLLSSGPHRSHPQIIIRGSQGVVENIAYGFTAGLGSDLTTNDIVVKRRVYNGPPLDGGDLIKPERLVSGYKAWRLSRFLFKQADKIETAANK